MQKVKFIQGTGKTSVDDEEWWKVDTQKWSDTKTLLGFQS